MPEQALESAKQDVNEVEGEGKGMSENESEQEELRREIERTRSELGETVEALSHKADVKAQPGEGQSQADKVEQAKTRRAKAHDLQQKMPEQSATCARSCRSRRASASPSSRSG